MHQFAVFTWRRHNVAGGRVAHCADDAQQAGIIVIELIIGHQLGLNNRVDFTLRQQVERLLRVIDQLNLIAGIVPLQPLQHRTFSFHRQQLVAQLRE